MKEFEKIIAKNNKLETAKLTDHTKAVLNMGMCVSEVFDIPENNIAEFRNKLALSLILHDIGKCTARFQKYIASDNLNDEGVEETQKGYRHNIVSWAFAVSCLSGLSNPRKYQDVTSSLLYHHSVYGDDGASAFDVMHDIVSGGSEKGTFGIMRDFYNYMAEYANGTFGTSIGTGDTAVIADEDDFMGDRTTVSGESLYVKHRFENGTIDHTSMKTVLFSALIRSILVYCDREVSSCRNDNQRILANDTEYISEVFAKHTVASDAEPDYSGYDQERLGVQAGAVDDILASGCATNFLKASAGFGKTLMGLMWFFKTRKKTLWVVPRNIIAENTFRSVVSELDKMGIGSGVRVGLYYSGKFQAANFCEPSDCKLADCDILVINIDGFLSYYSKNNMSTMLIDHYQGNVIFDEYHEVVSDDPMFAAFVNLLYTRIHYTHSETLLLSATYIPISHLIGADESNSKVWNLPIYGGDVKVNVSVSNNAETAVAPENSFTIMTTVSKAQAKYMAETGSKMLIHAKYTDTDRKAREEWLYSHYGKRALHESKPKVISTSLIGVGLDVSAMHIADECVTPEDTIQRCCGRGSRFREYGEIDYTVITPSPYKGSNLAKYIKRTYGDGYDTLHTRWIEELSKLDGKQVTKNDLYALRDEFYDDKAVRKAYRKYTTDLYNKSSADLNEIKLKSGYMQNNDDGTESIPSGMTYRGASQSMFVTVLDPNGQAIDPIVCERYMVKSEERNEEKYGTTTENSKMRYNFLCNIIGDNAKYVLRGKRYGIEGKCDAGPEKCSRLAYSSKTPLLLCTFSYNSELGLFGK